MPITVLPDAVVNKISAGEVVERPVSVVRELVDNALDAGATEISVALEQGGHSLIRVTDNGCGMDGRDLRLAFQRHATSKITNEDDLAQIRTLGFRGEALPSIAAVSRVRVRSRTADDAPAAELEISGGEFGDVRQCVAPRGTEFEISQLFFNTPVRRKFLKTPKTEELRVKTWLQHVSIAHPNVRFRMSTEGREVFNLAPRADSIERAREILGASLMPFSDEVQGTHLSGLVGHPAIAGKDTTAWVLLINGRLVSDKMILRAVREGFDSTLKDREFPVGFLSLTVPPHLVDVNVHPQKSEVRFIAPQSIFVLVRSVVRRALTSFHAVPGGMTAQLASRAAVPLELRRSEPVAQHVIPATSAASFPTRGGAALASQPDFFRGVPMLQPEQVMQPRTLQNFRFGALDYVGQIFECYLLCQHQDEFVIVDMHAAHERCNYNRIRQGIRSATIAVQALLVPISVRVSEEGAAQLAGERETFERFGIRLEVDPSGAVTIHSVPTLLVGKDVAGLIKEMASADVPDGMPGMIDERLDHIAARIACHASVRSGRTLERGEVYALFKDLDSTAMASACPHGRPITATFSRDAVERWFGRDR